MAKYSRAGRRMPDPELQSVRAKRNSSINGLLMFFVVVVAAIFVMSVLLRVSDIRVEGNEHYTDAEIINAIDIEEGDNLFFFDRFAAISRVFAKLPYVEQVSVERSLPNKVVITVVECKALAYIELGEEAWTIDRNCKILGKATDEEKAGLIPVSGIKPGTLMIGEQLLTEDNNQVLVQYLADVLFQIQERGLASGVSKLDFTDPNHIYFYYTDKYTVELGDAGKVEYKFGMLLSALGQLKLGDVGVIDLSSGSSVHFRPN